MRGTQIRISSILGIAFALVVLACSSEESPGSLAGPELSANPLPTAPSPASVAPSDPSSPPTAPARESAIPALYVAPVIPYPEDVRPALEYPDLESYGAARISFTLPPLPSTVGAISCLWAPSEVDGELVTSNPSVVDIRGPSVVLAGEHVDIWLGGEWPGTFGSTLTIHRHGAASYVDGPGTGTVGSVGIAPDGSSGRLRFEDLEPSPPTRSSQTTSPDDWLRPLGDDPTMSTLTGTVEWACEPPPSTFSVGPAICGNGPSPLCLGDPEPIVLVARDQRQIGVDQCGSFVGDTCGPTVYSLPETYMAKADVGELLRFELPDERSHFLHWSIRWADQSDAERWTRLAEAGSPSDNPAFEPVWEGGPSEGHAIEFVAPPPGDWSVELQWVDDRHDEAGLVRTLFRIVVG